MLNAPTVLNDPGWTVCEGCAITGMQHWFTILHTSIDVIMLFKVCGKGSLYQHNRPTFVDEHTVRLTGFVCESANVTKDGISGGLKSTARPQLHYPWTIFPFNTASEGK